MFRLRYTHSISGTIHDSHAGAFEENQKRKFSPHPHGFQGVDPLRQFREKHLPSDCEWDDYNAGGRKTQEGILTNPTFPESAKQTNSPGLRPNRSPALTFPRFCARL